MYLTDENGNTQEAKGSSTRASSDNTYEMLDFLKGPENVSPYEK